MENRIKQAFAEGRAALGMFVMIPSPALVEMSGHAGFDFVILDTEHGAAGPEGLEHLVRAAETAGTTPIVRVTVNDRALSLRALDAGALGVLVPHVLSAADARAAVAAAKYPPEGIRGLATTARAGRHGFRSVAEHIARSNREILVAVQIEDAAAVPAAEAIAAVPGVDVLFVGPSDLSISMGYPGQADHPAVQEAVTRIFKAAEAARREVGYFVRDAAGAKILMARGVRFLTFSSTSVIGAAFRDVMKGVRDGA
jgi:4-hydroxy-2-oxoheptanedioate aldolase